MKQHFPLYHSAPISYIFSFLKISLSFKIIHVLSWKDKVIEKLRSRVTVFFLTLVVFFQNTRNVL